MEGTTTQTKPRSYVGKRLFDRLVVLLVSPIALPVGLLVTLLVKLEDGGPALFRQRRLGAHGQVFACVKFRSMVVDAPRQGTGMRVHRDDDRITRVGRFIRRWGLDELPQLWNVWRGEMSVVGPRPALERDLARYDDNERRRLEARPGLAGWAWIHGRRGIPWKQRFEMDVWYVDHMSLRLDVVILLRAFLTLFGGRGLYPTRAVLEESERNESPS